MKNFGKRVKARRKELGLTRGELGRRVGLTKATVGKYENCNFSDITLTRIRKFAAALDLTAQELIGD